MRDAAAAVQRVVGRKQNNANPRACRSSILLKECTTCKASRHRQHGLIHQPVEDFVTSQKPQTTGRNASPPSSPIACRRHFQPAAMPRLAFLLLGQQQTVPHPDHRNAVHPFFASTRLNTAVAAAVRNRLIYGYKKREPCRHQAGSGEQASGGARYRRRHAGRPTGAPSRAPAAPRLPSFQGRAPLCSEDGARSASRTGYITGPAGCPGPAPTNVGRRFHRKQVYPGDRRRFALRKLLSALELELPFGQ